MKGIWNALLISGRGFSSAQFGKIRNALDPRILQFALKYLLDGFLTGFEATRREVPLPWVSPGRGCREAAGEGWSSVSRSTLTRPSATLCQRERDFTAGCCPMNR